MPLKDARNSLAQLPEKFRITQQQSKKTLEKDNVKAAFFMEISYSVKILFADQTVIEPQLVFAGDGVYTGSVDGLSVQLKTGGEILLDVQNKTGKAIHAISWELLCKGEGIADCRVPMPCTDSLYSGVVKLDEQTPAGSMLSGLFYGADKPCLYLGTKLPQNNVHLYQVRPVDADTVTITGTTEFTVGQSVMEALRSEITLMVTGETPLAATQKWADHLADIPIPDPMVGWNSWDYYFTTVSSQAVRENLEVIKQDPILKDKLKAIVVDDGWETCVGEWYPNHRFPEGLTYLADMIKSYGMIPGIWTNGPQTEGLCEPALRHPEYYTLDSYGIPFGVDGKQVIDPTHPAAEAFILDTYTRLYQAGFRIFKVDFIRTLVKAKRFHDPACGPYEAIRRLLKLVRQAVGPDSHIVGCAYPPECGPGIVDSSRISGDIHNHWLHIVWIMEHMQAKFWCNGKLFRCDPDMLVVRGSETSLEEETNVYNPWNLVPPGKTRFTSRWRRGPVFNAIEAETWANVVVFSGGDIMLGDRLSMLNEKGLQIVYDHLTPHMYAAVPLDLGDKEASEIWYDSHTASILLVNTQEQSRTMELDFARYGIAAPASVSCNKYCTYENGVARISLQAHESAIVTM